MPTVLLVQLRPVGDKRGSYRLIRSDQAGGSTYRSKDEACVKAMGLADDFPSILLLEYNHMGEIGKIYRCHRGQWRKLEVKRR